MKSFKVAIFVATLFLLLSSCKRDKESTSSANLFYPVKEYTLKNGLKVFLSVNKDAPRIQTAITFKAGSKYDPASTTGLAHYLEHMLFKGSEKFGTLNYEKEKPFLDSIGALFELRMKTSDESEKQRIYKRIDSFSYEASKLAIPNEYDKMVSSIGAKGTNAFTDRDLTCYINDIPTSALEKWLFLESDRFKHLVLRIFHTELEAVYEEFNMSTAYDQQWSSQAVDSLLMPNHPYGTQTTIGLSEHLKNPSFKNIKDYFDKYYVPNNCAIVMSGDLDPDKTIALIEKYFSDWKHKEVPVFVKQEPIKIAAPMYTEKFGLEPEHVYVGFRFNGADTKDPIMVKLVDALLSNGKGSGILDLNLKLNQKLLEGYSTYEDNKDYVVHKLFGMPKEGQKLEEVKELLLTQIDSIKQGKFPDWMLSAVIDNTKLDLIRKTETNQGRVFDIVFAFVKDIPLKEYQKELSELEKVTKADIVKFANERYGQNFAVCYKRFGEPSLFKVEKPAITPVWVNKDEKSVFAKTFDAMPESTIEPLFCDFKKSIAEGLLNNQTAFFYQKNELNPTFKLNFIIAKGTDHDPILSLALDFLPYMYTDKYSSSELKQEFYKLGLEYAVSVGREESVVSLSGLEKNMENGLVLLEYVLRNAKVDKVVYENFVADVFKKRTDLKLDKDVILFEGLMNYAKYGAKNPFNSVLSNDELKNLNTSLLEKQIESLIDVEHIVYYFGQKPMAEVKNIIELKHKPNYPLKTMASQEQFIEQDILQPIVLFANYNMKQAQIYMLSKGKPLDKGRFPQAAVFNEYFGGSMASVVFQEIREKMALAYSAWGGYSIARKQGKADYVNGFVGTQSDKMRAAVSRLNELLNELPRSEQNFDLAKTAILNQIRSERITRDAIFATYRKNQKQGIDYDIRKDVYEQCKKMKFEDMQAFFDSEIKQKPFVYLVIGNKADLDMNYLASLGQVKQISLEELYGY